MRPQPRWIGRTIGVLMVVTILIRAWQMLQAYLHGR
jgi:hypothetical protein